MATKKAAEKAAPAPTPVAKMTKTQTVKALAEKLEIDGKQVQAFLDALLEMATEQTRAAGEFTIPGLGKLVKAERKERMGRNPATVKRSRSLPRRRSSSALQRLPRRPSHRPRPSARIGRKLFAINRLRPIRIFYSLALQLPGNT